MLTDRTAELRYKMCHLSRVRLQHQCHFQDLRRTRQAFREVYGRTDVHEDQVLKKNSKGEAHPAKL